MSHHHNDNTYVIKIINFSIKNRKNDLILKMFWMGGKIPQLGYLAPRGEDTQGGGQDTPGYLHPRGASCPGGQDKLLHRPVCEDFDAGLFVKNVDNS